MDSTKVGNGVHQCHQCRSRDEHLCVVECKRCESNKYCVPCLTKWYPNVTEEEFIVACPVCRNNCNCKTCLRQFSSKDILQKAVANLSGVIDLTGQVDDLQFVKEPEVLKGDINAVDNTNGWLCDTESEDGLLQDQEPDTIEDSGTSIRTSGFWRGHDVGLAAENLLQSVEHHYPNTFRGVHFRFKELWPPILKRFYEVINGFMETSVDALDHECVIRIQGDLKELERFGFDLSWAHQRLNMVEKLKFGNEPLCQELAALEESLQLLKQRVTERQNVFMEVHEMLMEAQLEYNGVTHARNNKAQEIAKKFGDKYDQILKGHLGFGMLPGY